MSRHPQHLLMEPVPGQVTAAFITPECRGNRGDQGAWDEAVDRLLTQYIDVLNGWAGRAEQPTLNLILTMERPGV